MSAFCGAWAWDGGAVDRLLTDDDRARLRERLGAEGPVTEIARGPLWLVAAGGKTRQREGRVLAWAGSCDTDPSLSVPDPDDPWEGHYALAWADLERRALILLRDLSGGYCLYYARIGPLLLFSDSLEPLLAYPGIPRRLNAETLAELLLAGVIFCGSETLFAGVKELPPGQSRGFPPGSLRRDGSHFLEEGGPRSPGAGSAGALRRALGEATAQVLARDRETAVALSGGIDSATIAALAAELLGPKNVTALTYEFADPLHPSEAPAAAATARRLGLRHHVVTISRREQCEAIVSACRHAGDGRMRGNPAWFAFLSKAAGQGFGKLLTGFGIEQVLGSLSFQPYLRDLSQKILRTPLPDLTLRRWLPFLKYVAPARAAWPPHPDIYGCVLLVLRHRGLIRDIAGFFPPGLAALAKALEDSQRVRAALEQSASLPLSEQLMRACFDAYLMPRMFLRKAAVARGAGVTLAAPALLRRCALKAPDFSRQAANAPDYSRHLQIEAMAGTLPEEVLRRPKIQEQAIPPLSWLEELLREQDAAADGYAGLQSLLPAEAFAAARRHFPYRLAQAALMKRLFLEPPVSRPPAEAIGA